MPAVLNTILIGRLPLHQVYFQWSSTFHPLKTWKSMPCNMSCSKFDCKPVIHGPITSKCSSSGSSVITSSWDCRESILRPVLYLILRTFIFEKPCSQLAVLGDTGKRYSRAFIKVLCSRSVGFFSWAFLVFPIKRSTKGRIKQLGKVMAKCSSHPVNLTGARPLMNPLVL